MDKELQEEKKRNIKVEERLFDVLFSMKRSEVVENSIIVCSAEGKPSYGSYAHLIEDQGTVEELLELANEELKNKDMLIKNVANTLLAKTDLNKEDKEFLAKITTGFTK